MRSQAVRLTLLLLFVITVGVSAYLFWMGESRATAEAEAGRRFDEQGLTTSRDILELRASQQAYVAAGQGHEYWSQKAGMSAQAVRDGLQALRAAATTDGARTAIDAALRSLQDFAQLDRRARDYARAGQNLLASDMIFGRGAELTGAAAASLDEATAVERASRDTMLAAIRRRQLFAIGAAAAAALLVALLLVPQPRAPIAEPLTVSLSPQPAPAAVDPPALHDAIEEGWSRARPAVPEPAPETAVAAAPQIVATAVEDTVPEPVAAPASQEPAPLPLVNLNEIAALCTDLARLTDTRSLQSALARAADVLDANGIVLWIADPDGRELSPIVTHGYSTHVVTRLGTILRDDPNATAAAFRTSLLQTVRIDEISDGAIAAPLVTPTACVGVMAAEVRRGGEQDEAKLAAATIVAAQLATLVGPPSARPQARAEAG